MILIAALGNDRVIGSGDGMPWDVPDEYAQFLRFIDGCMVIMGRRSWEIFGADLTSAHNVVISRSATTLRGAHVARSLDAAERIARGFGVEVFCAGGARVYAEALPRARAMYLSFIHGKFAGDAFFPEFDEAEWIVEREEEHPEFTFVAYRRRVGA